MSFRRIPPRRSFEFVVMSIHSGASGSHLKKINTGITHDTQQTAQDPA